jgi:hypothetical protein
MIEGKIKGTGRRIRRHKQLLDDLKETRVYWKLKEEALDRTMWRTLVRLRHDNDIYISPIQDRFGVGLLVDTVAMGQCYLRVLRFSSKAPCSFRSSTVDATNLRN